MTAPESVATNGNAEVTVTVTNTGDKAGDEVVQLYLTHEGVSDAPIRSLKGFKRVYLEPGESKDVSFTLTPREFARYTNADGISVHPGTVHIYVGGSQPDTAANTSGPSTTPRHRILRLTGSPVRLPY